MNKKLEDYLDTIDHYLKPMPASERIDIVNEIKSELSELELQNDLTADEIIDKMGNPKESAKAYLFLTIRLPASQFTSLCVIYLSSAVLYLSRTCSIRPSRSAGSKGFFT